MHPLIAAGKRNLILLSISILMISLITIYIDQTARVAWDYKKLLDQSIRFFLTIILLNAIYVGKNWARITLTVLFALAINMGIVALFKIQSSIINKVPLIVMVFIYGRAIYLFHFSTSFKANWNYKRSQQ